MSVILKSTGGGEVILQEPSTASIFTQTLPAQTGTVALLQTPSFVTTIGVGGVTPSTSGAGITFPATQSASSDANTLDDYEEGTFTPIAYGLSSAGTTTYSDQVGFYTKVGNLVTVFYQVTVSAMTGTGALALGGFPFSTNSAGASCAPVMIDGLNWGGGSYVQLYIGSSRTYAIPYYMTDDSSWNAQQVTNESQAYIATITYRV